MSYEELVQSIQSLNTEDAFHARLDAGQWRSLAGYLTRHEIRGGDLLIKQGDVDRQAYFLGQGTLQVYVSGAAPGTSRIAILRPGAIVGEVGLFSDGPRMANVEAMTPCVVWALRLPRFEELSQRAPAIALEVLRAAASVMAARMRANMLRQLPTA
jgi:CRP/FNR family transcriptional regulator, cyclic AMP receptor protein